MFALILFVVFASGLGVSADHYRTQTMIGVIGMLAFLGAFIGKRIHWSAGVAFTFAAVSAAFCSFNPSSPFAEYGVAGVTMFDASTSQGLVFLLSATLPIVICPDYYIDFFVQGFGWLGFVSSLAMIAKCFMGEPVTGVLDNPALDATFLALLYPLIAIRPTLDPFDGKPSMVKELPVSFLFTALMVVCPPVAIILSKSNTGLALLAGEILLYFFMKNGWTKRTIAICIAGVAGTYVAAITFLGHKFMNDDGRCHVWKIAIAQWLDLHHYALGTGTGTFSILGPLAQKENGYTQFFLWAHNDWLQILFEQGLVGACIIILVFLYMLRGSSRARGYWLFVTVAGLGAAAVTQMPLRIFPMALFSALICRLSFSRLNYE